MALISIKRASLLGPSLVLAPERYDPRRSMSSTIETVSLGELVTIVRKTVAPSDSLDSCLVLDTSDVREGIVVGRKDTTAQIGSTKKVVDVGDVIISRLRPYLRQVAFVDAGIHNSNGALLLCSTEFFVLRDVERKPISFLVPFLLSDQVQEVLSASQEGGHHPRFDESTLASLPVPRRLIDDRSAMSAAFEDAVRSYRTCESGIASLISKACDELGECASSGL